MLLISLSHEKQTATKPRASRDREFLSYEQVCAIGVASPTPANPHHAAARRACRATDTLATREAEPTNTKSSFQACQSGPARNLSTLSRRRVGLRTRRSASWPWPGPRRWYCCRQRHWLTGNLNRSGPRGVIAPLEVRHTEPASQPYPGAAQRARGFAQAVTAAWRSGPPCRNQFASC